MQFSGIKTIASLKENWRSHEKSDAGFFVQDKASDEGSEGAYLST